MFVREILEYDSTIFVDINSDQSTYFLCEYR